MTDPVYENYWRRKRLFDERRPTFRLIRTSGRAPDGELLRVISEAVRGKASLLDFGAGSLHVRTALLAAGFSGRYDTLDIGKEYEYTYSSLAEAAEQYEAVLLLDVLEHLHLAEGLTLLKELAARLCVGGTLIVQTPNARCVRSPLSSDITHLQCFNLNDLWAYLTCLNCDVAGYRVAFRADKRLSSRLLDFAGRALTTRLLGLDYADNILAVATKLA